MLLPDGYHIDETDSVDIFRLCQRIKELERRNHVLTTEKGFPLAEMKFTPMTDLTPRLLDYDRKQLFLTAQWTSERDPITGKLHVYGVAKGPDNLSLTHQYFIENERLTGEQAMTVLGHMHKDLIRTLGTTIIKKAKS